MSAIAQQLKPFTMLLGNEPMPKKDFLKMAHQAARSTQQHLVSLLQMMQFSMVRRQGDEIIFE